jgi:hypothetical protein
MRAAARASSVRGIRETRNGHSLGPTTFAVVLAEFRRAIAAARRYEDLRYGSGRQWGMAPLRFRGGSSRNSIRPHGPWSRAAPNETFKSTGADPVRAATLISANGQLMTHSGR